MQTGRARSLSQLRTCHDIETPIKTLDAVISSSMLTRFKSFRPDFTGFDGKDQMKPFDSIVLKFRDVTELSETDLHEVLSIRNQPSVRSNMYTSHEIGKEEHGRWANALRKSDDRKFFAVETGKEIVGVAGISAINPVHKRADWAFYISENCQGRGIGSALEQQFIDFVFSSFDIEKLNCEVIQFNDKVIAMHERFGFLREGFRRDHVIRDGKKYGAVMLGITKQEWDART